MAQAFPNSTFVGSDYHEGSIETARQRASEAGVGDRVRFEAAPAAAYPGERLRPGDDVRLPARHGRPGRRRAPRARRARRRRHLDDRRADAPATASRTTSTRSAAPTTGSRRCSARPPRCPRRSGSRSARRPARRGSATSSRPAASRGSAAPPRRRSTSSSRSAVAVRSPPGDDDRQEARDDRRADARAVPRRRGVRRARRRAGRTTSVYGDGEPTVLLLPTWSIVHSRALEGADPVPRPALPRRHVRRRAATAAPTGRRAAALRRAEFAADALAVLDATGAERASSSACRCGAQRGAARSPPTTRSAVDAAVCIGPAVPLGPRPRARPYSFDDAARHRRGLGEVQPPLLAARLPRLPRVLLRAGLHRAALDQADRGLRRLGPRDDARDADRRTARTPTGAGDDARRERCARVALPGARDPRRPTTDRSAPRAGAALAELTGGRLVTLEGAGHAAARARPGQRQPAAARVRRAAGAAAGAGARGRRARRARALYISSPIGLGHARRDVAIADELRRLHPDLEIDWLAQHPVTARARGARRAHPPGQRRAGQRVGAHRGESRRARPALLPGAAPHGRDPGRELHGLPRRRRARSSYDLWIGDEAWDVDYFLHENPELKRAPYAWLTDFVGWLPMPDGGEREAFLTADYNAEMIEHIARYPRVRDRAIFVGDPDDIVARPFGPDLPLIRDWTDAALRVRRLRDGLRPGRRSPIARRCGAQLGYGDDEQRLRRRGRRLGRRRATCCAA